MRIKIALALMSAIFIMVWVAILLGYILLSSPLQLIRRPVLFIELLSIISFLGSVFFWWKQEKYYPDGIWQSRYVFFYLHWLS